MKWVKALILFMLFVLLLSVGYGMATYWLSLNVFGFQSVVILA